MSVIFLSLEEVLEIHQDQMTRHGGTSGIRDKNLLLSALAQPSSTFSGAYLHQNIFDMAAAYLFHIVKNHPFIDGNKRTAIVSALIFLDLNEKKIDSTNDELEEIVLKAAEGNFNKQEISLWFQEKCKG